jgi:cell wall-associated NlpC family hydrolase
VTILPDSIDVADLVGATWCDDGQGVDRATGFQCWGLARAVLARVGVVLPESPERALAEWSDAAASLGEERPRELRRAGDVLLMKGEVLGHGALMHVGVVINLTQFIHATRDGVRLDRTAVFERAGQVIKVVRPMVVRPGGITR